MNHVDSLFQGWMTHIVNFCCYTINVGRFTGLNICSFSPMKFLREDFCGPLASSVYYLTIAKYSQKNFRGTLKNCESLAQQNFPCLPYIEHIYVCVCVCVCLSVCFCIYDILWLTSTFPHHRLDQYSLSQPYSHRSPSSWLMSTLPLL